MGELCCRAIEVSCYNVKLVYFLFLRQGSNMFLYFINIQHHLSDKNTTLKDETQLKHDYSYNDEVKLTWVEAWRDSAVTKHVA